MLLEVRKLLGDAVIDAHEHRGDATVLVERERLHGSLATLRDDPLLCFNMLMDLTAVDYLGRDPRFEVVYHLASLPIEPGSATLTKLRGRLRVKVGVPEADCQVASCVDLWVAANWMEREVWDMYGIAFSGHPELRRILLYEGFQGHPLRKDYPKERRQPLIGPRN